MSGVMCVILPIASKFWNFRNDCIDVLLGRRISKETLFGVSWSFLSYGPPTKNNSKNVKNNSKLWSNVGKITHITHLRNEFYRNEASRNILFNKKIQYTGSRNTLLFIVDIFYSLWTKTLEKGEIIQQNLSRRYISVIYVWKMSEIFLFSQ